MTLIQLSMLGIANDIFHKRTCTLYNGGSYCNRTYFPPHVSFELVSPKVLPSFSVYSFTKLISRASNDFRKENTLCLGETF